MSTPLTWDETKRLVNLEKHGLDFADAGHVLDSRYRLDVLSAREGEVRVQSLSYAMRRLEVLSVVHIERQGAVRIISFRPASQSESETYYEWIGKEVD